jgi:hypothetical protein
MLRAAARWYPTSVLKRLPSFIYISSLGIPGQAREVRRILTPGAASPQKTGSYMKHPGEHEKDKPILPQGEYH